MIYPTLSRESALWEKGFLHVAGVDEAGKGPLAGPVTVGAVIIHNASQVVKTVRDSKLMTAKQRELAYTEIITMSSAYGIGIVEAEEIDGIGIDFAVKKAMLLALQEAEKKLGKPISYVLVDGSKTKPLNMYLSERILKGGLYYYSIAASSILAKVTRDRLMYAYHETFPQYEFNNHVGYGTSRHFALLKEFGPCPIHRKTFAPIKNFR